MFRFRFEDFRGCESCMDFGVFRLGFVGFRVVAEGEEVVLYGADSV